MKKISLVLIACLTISCAFSQTFMHGAGAGVYVDKAQSLDANAYATLIYSPRFNFMEKEEFALSVGVPLSVGFSGSYNSNTYSGTENNLSFMFNAPLIVNINVGRGSTKENERRFGYFAGAGFGYHYGTTHYDDNYYFEESTSTSFSAYGPAANAGLRFGVGESHKNIEVLFSYMKGIDDSKANIFGVSALFNF